MTSSSNETKIWIVAFAVSLALHAMLIMLVPSYNKNPAAEKIMTVRLTETETPKIVTKLPLKNVQPMKAERDKHFLQQSDSGSPAPAKAKISPKTVTAKTVQKSEHAVRNTVTHEISTAPAKTANTQSSGAAPSGSSTGDMYGSPKGNGNGNGTGSGTGSGSGSSGGDGNGEFVNIDTLTITKKVMPDYPAFSRKRHEEGTVKILITIESGSVSEARIESSSGSERLDSSALRAVRQWRFEHSGKVRARVPITFKLD